MHPVSATAASLVSSNANRDASDGQRLAVDLRNCSRRLEDPQPAILLSPPATQFGCGSSSNGINEDLRLKGANKTSNIP